MRFQCAWPSLWTDKNPIKLTLTSVSLPLNCKYWINDHVYGNGCLSVCVLNAQIQAGMTGHKSLIAPRCCTMGRNGRQRSDRLYWNAPVSMASAILPNVRVRCFVFPLISSCIYISIHLEYVKEALMCGVYVLRVFVVFIGTFHLSPHSPYKLSMFEWKIWIPECAFCASQYFLDV